MVKLPGPAPDKPNIYDFCTTYEAMYQDLRNKDLELYPILVSILLSMGDNNLVS